MPRNLIGQEAQMSLKSMMDENFIRTHPDDIPQDFMA